ncbi:MULTISPECIES: hypothetical protein [unclassified Halomonas]|uniref:hypothetical protein n=1 Tax=unclassified Halomonas TaxID=2609666 RepID=UPI0007DA46FD|nr:MULTISPECIES: hypothetical protein [unclassified Halomonas]MBT2787351.1 hypothetical protein [Halomonas sp. ISL-106]MBT2796287.1 hypothetical protein [Halomonas sp. ISL-104]MBT2801150.1 hypothetical protein [Halomonas sp. ISL-56]OAL57562.1 hypothetical protein A6R74_12385 [Halomonas sp. ALS9]
MKINYNPTGKWSVEAVKERYSKLSLSLGSVDGFEPFCKTYTNRRGFTWVYNIMDSVVDGVRLGDKACVQLAIDYIRDNEMYSKTGYIRARMARALKSADLSDSQKKELALIFLHQLETGVLYQEYREYCRLFRKIGVEPYRREIKRYGKARRQYIKRAANRLLA